MKMQADEQAGKRPGDEVGRLAVFGSAVGRRLAFGLPERLPASVTPVRAMVRRLRRSWAAKRGWVTARSNNRASGPRRVAAARVAVNARWAKVRAARAMAGQAVAPGVAGGEIAGGKVL